MQEEDKKLKSFEHLYMQMIDMKAKGMRNYVIDEETGLAMKSPRAENLTPRQGTGSSTTPRQQYYTSTNTPRRG